MFIDEAKVRIKAGDGGDGCSSLYTDKYTRHGRPDGGPGGRGGDVIIRTSENVQTLLDFHYRQHLTAGRGAHGSSNNKKGHTGEDLVLLVPAGTIIRDAGDGLQLRDLASFGDEVIIARGGRGGRGNSGGGIATKGSLGEEKDVLLELKLIADVGIIGYPNAGKSTLISKVSSARPKIANYPFTTKEPVLGVVRVYEDRSFVMADIPGLIEGAHKGRGLGDRFLRHIERTRLLVHLVDISGQEGRLPWSDYASVIKELKSYSKELASKPQIIVLNKIDSPGAQDNVKAFRKKVKKKAYPISALNGEGVGGLMKEIARRLEDA